MPDPRLFGLIGYPLSHSFSGKYFSEKFSREGWEDCRYELFPIPSVTGLPRLIEEHPFLEGLNVTIPYKQQVLPYLHDRSAIPAGLDACNCIRIRKGMLSGYNTDVTGFRESLRPLLQPWHTGALVLGKGGAAAAVLYALGELNIPAKLVSRQPQPGADLTYSDLDESLIRAHTIIINCTPLGMHPHTGTCPDIPYHWLTPEHLLYDLVYNPARTLFLQKGEERGAAVKNGEEMLILQAEESWRIWNAGAGHLKG